jgi:hypothetical protein
MTGTHSDPPSIKRLFRELSDAEVADIEKASALARVGRTDSFGWDELLCSQRVLIVSEAGAGKTYECQAQQAKLWKAGEPAFFLDLATLAASSVSDMLGGDEEERLNAWLRSQSEIATFFLDSIDELKLTLHKFDQALKRLNKALAGQLGRARIIITARPVPIDRELIVKHLPIPVSEEAGSTAEAFADMVMDHSKNKPTDNAGPKAWRNVGLMPLSRQQMREFVARRGRIRRAAAGFNRVVFRLARASPYPLPLRAGQYQYRDEIKAKHRTHGESGAIARDGNRGCQPTSISRDADTQAHATA